MDTTTNAANPDRWNRAKLTIHLSAKRKAKLATIAASIAAGTTPTEAVEHAIDQAFGSVRAGPPLSTADDADALACRIDELHEAMSELATEVRRNGHRQDSAHHEASQNVATILDLISAASASMADEDAGMGDEGSEASLDLATWLRNELARFGQTTAKSVIARAQWTGMAKATAKLASLGLEVALAAIDEKPVDQAMASPALTQIGLVEIDSELFRSVAANASRPLFVVMNLSATRGISCTFFAASVEGALAEKMATFTI